MNNREHKTVVVAEGGNYRVVRSWTEYDLTDREMEIFRLDEGSRRREVDRRYFIERWSVDALGNKVWLPVYDSSNKFGVKAHLLDMLWNAVQAKA